MKKDDTWVWTYAGHYADEFLRHIDCALINELNDYEKIRTRIHFAVEEGFQEGFRIGCMDMAQIFYRDELLKAGDIADILGLDAEELCEEIEQLKIDN